MEGTNRRQLMFFTKIKEEELESEFALSSLQTFETSLFLLSEERWPNVIPLLFGACESLLKVVTGRTGKKPDGSDWTAYELMEEFKKQNKELSDELHEKAGKLRRWRNDLIHKGYSPHDDAQCVKYFFNPGVPYFDALLRFGFGSDKRELSGESSAVFWDVYRDTQKVVQKKEKSASNGFGQSFEYLGMLAKKYFKLGPEHMAEVKDANVLLPLDGHLEAYEDYLEGQDSDFSDVEFSFRESKIREFDEGDAAVMDLNESGFRGCGESLCPACDSSSSIVSLEYDEKSGSYKGVKSFVCLNFFCPAFGKIFSDPDVTSVFHWGKLTEAQKQYFASEECNCEVDSFNLFPPL